MTSVTFKYLLDKEINTLNKRIDRKILNGRSYYLDAKKHRALIAQYRRINLQKT